MVEAVIAAVGGWWFVAAILVATLGVGRWARLVTYDTFPPAAWIRQQWMNLTHKHEEWANLFFCPWCFTPWLFLVCFAHFAASFYHPFWAWSWWLLWGWGALSYVTSMIIARDERPEK